MPGDRSPIVQLRRITLTTSLGDEPPTEFRLFTAGVNATSKGEFLFDEPAAASVIAAYQRAGVDLMVDLNHDSLDEQPVREDARDARGWFQLELRNGELWAVNVTWTPDGDERIRSKKQRYISPAFRADESGRILEIDSVAICGKPATYNTPALVAASRTFWHPDPKVRAAGYALARGATLRGIAPRDRSKK